MENSDTKVFEPKLKFGKLLTNFEHLGHKTGKKYTDIADLFDNFKTYDKFYEVAKEDCNTDVYIGKLIDLENYDLVIDAYFDRELEFFCYFIGCSESDINVPDHPLKHLGAAEIWRVAQNNVVNESLLRYLITNDYNSLNYNKIMHTLVELSFK